MTDKIDKQDLILLDILQSDFPLVPDPWEDIGIRTGMTSETVLKRIINLTDLGIIRNISPLLESGKSKNVVSTLIAMQVPEDDMNRISAIINQFPEVSHNFRRECKYNLWFTLSAGSSEEINKIMQRILNSTGIDSSYVLNLPTIHRYKIHLRFPFLKNSEGVTDG